MARAAGVEPPAVDTVDELVAVKRRLRAKIQGRFIAAHPLYTESNLQQAAPRLGGGTVKWSYRRFDERLCAPLAGLHATLDARVAFALRTNSGMAAISAALESLDAALPDGTPLCLPIDAYFESLRVAGRLRRLKPMIEAAPRPGAVVYVDTITTNDRSDFDPRGLAAVLYDTTCADSESPRIAALLDRCRAARVLCVLLRSHLKLDCLGLEYGRLGSIIVVLPDRPDRQQVALARKIRRGAVDRLALTGGSFTPEAIFPLADDPEARALNQARNHTLFANQALAGPLLKAACAPTGVTIPHHGCFVVLRPIWDTIWAGSRYLLRLIAALQHAGLAAREAPSFAYDLIGATLLRVPDRGQASIRLSLPDFAVEDIHRAVEIIGEEASGWLPTRPL